MVETVKGIPKEDGTGRGRRANIIRGKCNSPPPVGKGMDRKGRTVY